MLHSLVYTHTFKIEQVNLQEHSSLQTALNKDQCTIHVTEQSVRKTLCLVKHNLAQQILSFRFIHVCNFSFICGHKQNCAHEGYQLSLTKVLFQDFALTQLLMKLSEDYQQVKKDLLFPQQIVDHLKIIHLKLYFPSFPCCICCQQQQYDPSVLFISWQQGWNQCSNVVFYDLYSYNNKYNKLVSVLPLTKTRENVRGPGLDFVFTSTGFSQISSGCIS